MVYVRCESNIAAELIPEVDSAFPEVPITGRFPADFIRGLIAYDGEVQIGWVYSPDTGMFMPPPAPPSPIDPPVPPESKYTEFLEGFMGTQEVPEND